MLGVFIYLSINVILKTCHKYPYVVPPPQKKLSCNLMFPLGEGWIVLFKVLFRMGVKVILS